MRPSSSRRHQRLGCPRLGIGPDVAQVGLPVVEQLTLTSWWHMIPARLSAIVMACLLASTASAQPTYRLLATNKTSTMQKEMQEAGDAGFHFVAVMGGETAASAPS